MAKYVIIHTSCEMSRELIRLVDAASPQAALDKYLASHYKMLREDCGLTEDLQLIDGDDGEGTAAAELKAARADYKAMTADFKLGKPKHGVSVAITEADTYYVVAQ